MALSVIWSRLFYMHNIVMVLVLSLSSMYISVFCVWLCVCVCVCACVRACVMGQVAWIKYDLIWFEMLAHENCELFEINLLCLTNRSTYLWPTGSVKNKYCCAFRFQLSVTNFTCASLIANCIHLLYIRCRRRCYTVIVKGEIALFSQNNFEEQFLKTLRHWTVTPRSPLATGRNTRFQSFFFSNATALFTVPCCRPMFAAWEAYNQPVLSTTIVSRLRFDLPMRSSGINYHQWNSGQVRPVHAYWHHCLLN